MNSAPRGQKTHKAPGRPGVLKKPQPLVVVVLAAFPRTAGPSLATPSLADAVADVVDSSSLRFLTAAALAARRKEEEKAKKEAAKRKGGAGGGAGASGGSFGARCSCWRGTRGRGRRGGRRNFLEPPLFDPLAGVDSGYVFVRQFSWPLFFVLLGSKVETCTCFGVEGFLEEFHATST